MPIYKPSELREFLEGLDAVPKKGLSQNFLIDGNIIRKIIKESEVQPGDVVLEIGPGPGSLTEALLESGASVFAVEKDAVLAAALDRLQTPDKRLTVLCEDIMQVPIEEKMRAILPKGKKGKVIANLPYHLTTPIIANLIPLREVFSSLTVMVQEEVARRFTATPGTKEYSSFTVFLEFYTKPKYAFGVSRKCFYPPPKVDSAIVILELREEPKISSPMDFFKLTRSAFKQRRKMLRSSLRELYGSQNVTESLEKIGCNPMARPEELSLEQFLQLFNYLKKLLNQ